MVLPKATRLSEIHTGNAICFLTWGIFEQEHAEKDTMKVVPTKNDPYLREICYCTLGRLPLLGGCVVKIKGQGLDDCKINQNYEII